MPTTGCTAINRCFGAPERRSWCAPGWRRPRSRYGTQLVADYFVPPSRLDENAAAVARFSAEHGEPWLSCPTPAEMSALLTAHGFTPRTDLSLREAVDPALWQRTDGFHPNDNARLVHAARAQSV